MLPYQAAHGRSTVVVSHPVQQRSPQPVAHLSLFRELQHPSAAEDTERQRRAEDGRERRQRARRQLRVPRRAAQASLQRQAVALFADTAVLAPV